MNMLISLRSEILKSKRTASIYLTIIAAAFGPFMSVLDTLFDEVIRPEEEKVFFNIIMIEKFQMTAFLVFPFFVILICTLLPQLEYKNNTWKQLLTSPQTKMNVFAAKFINVHRLIIIFLIVNQCCTLIYAVIIHLAKPSLDLLNQPVNVSEVVLHVVSSYISLLALISIQFWLGLRFRNFIAPIGIGVAVWFLGSLMVMNMKAPLAEYFPYSYHVYAAFPESRLNFDNVRWMSAGYAVLFLLIGFLDFKKRRMSS